MPENFEGAILEVWSVERLLNFQNLELSFSLPYLSSQLADREFKSSNLYLTDSIAESDFSIVNLSHWLNNKFPVGWEAWGTIFGTKHLFISYRYAAKPIVQQAKKFELGDGRSLALVINVISTNNNEIEFVVNLYALDFLGKPSDLPVNSQLTVLDASSEAVLIATSRIADIGLQLTFYAELGERFSVKIEHEHHKFTEYFIV